VDRCYVPDYDPKDPFYSTIGTDIRNLITETGPTTCTGCGIWSADVSSKGHSQNDVCPTCEAKSALANSTQGGGQYGQRDDGSDVEDALPPAAKTKAAPASAQVPIDLDDGLLDEEVKHVHSDAQASSSTMLTLSAPSPSAAAAALAAPVTAINSTVLTLSAPTPPPRPASPEMVAAPIVPDAAAFTTPSLLATPVTTEKKARVPGAPHKRKHDALQTSSSNDHDDDLVDDNNEEEPLQKHLRLSSDNHVKGFLSEDDVKRVGDYVIQQMQKKTTPNASVPTTNTTVPIEADSLPLTTALAERIHVLEQTLLALTGPLNALHTKIAPSSSSSSSK